MEKNGQIHFTMILKGIRVTVKQTRKSSNLFIHEKHSWSLSNFVRWNEYVQQGLPFCFEWSIYSVSLHYWGWCCLNVMIHQSFDFFFLLLDLTNTNVVLYEKKKKAPYFHYSVCDFIPYLSVKLMESHIPQVRKLKSGWKIQGSHNTCGVCLLVYLDVWKQST